MSNIEQEIQAAGANVAPLVSPADIEARIAAEWYVTGEQAVAHAKAIGIEHFTKASTANALSRLTLCIIVLDTGYMIVGYSAPVNPLAFDAETGRRVAREHAIEQIWPLLGFELRTSLSVIENLKSGD